MVSTAHAVLASIVPGLSLVLYSLGALLVKFCVVHNHVNLVHDGIVPFIIYIILLKEKCGHVFFCILNRSVTYFSNILLYTVLCVRCSEL